MKKRGKKKMCDNLDDDKKQQLKKILTKDRKKCYNLYDNEKTINKI